jgi:phospholipid/cholesterol/gamma-HCH transport system substrate-binding protein
MSRSLSRGQAVVLGLVVLTGLVLAAVGLFAVGSRFWRGGDSFEVSVRFADVGGVEEGGRVRIQGMDAGEVVAIETPAAAGEPVTVRLRLAGRFRPLLGDPRNARGQIGSDGIWSGKFVKLIPGRPTREPLPEQVVLASQPAPDLNEELTQTAVQLKQVLRDLNATVQEVRSGRGTLGQLVKNDKLYREVTGAAARARQALGEANETISLVKATLEEIRSGQGTLGKLVKSADAYADSLQTLEQVREMVSSVKQNADALKSMPIIRSYVIDAHKLLHRPDCKFERRWLTAERLFQPGQAVLTRGGRAELARLGRWLNAHKPKGSSVVVAAYAPPGFKYEAAQTLTQKQSEVVCEQLKSQYKVHKTGWWFWSKRPVQAVGCGTMDSPIPADARLPLPSPRVEVLVFVPQG